MAQEFFFFQDLTWTSQNQKGCNFDMHFYRSYAGCSFLTLCVFLHKVLTFFEPDLFRVCSPFMELFGKRNAHYEMRLVRSSLNIIVALPCKPLNILPVLAKI